MVDSKYSAPLPGNSNKDKLKQAAAPGPEKPKKDLTPIAQGKNRQKPLTKRIGETFKGDDANSVGSYILFDVALPAVKALVADAVSQGIERLLFGDAARRGPSSRTNYTSYSKPTSYNSRSTNRDSSGRRELSERARAAHDFDEVVLRERGSAEKVLDIMQEMINDYDVVSVADLLSLVEITPSHIDENWGWTDLRGARVMQLRRDEYLLDLPRPIDLKN